MATKTVIWTTYQNVQCNQCLPTTVLLCVTSELILPHVCPTGAASDEGFAWKTIEATLTQTAFSNSPTCIYSYNITYDDAQLVDPDTNLTSNQIWGIVCPGCLTDYIKEQAGNEILLRTPTPGNYELVTQHGCVFTFSATASDIVSGDAGNIIIVGTDGGAFLDCPAVEACLSSIVIVSTSPGNLISVGGDGGAFLNCASIASCVPDVTIVSADAGNQITAGTDGGAYIDCTVINACLDLLESSILAIGAIDSGAPSANGMTIDGCTGDGCTFIPQSASASFPGMVNTTTQTFAGVKTFANNTNFQGLLKLRAGQEVISTLSARIGGRVYHNITPGGNTAGSADTVVYTYAMLANTLGTNGDSLEIQVAGNLGATGSADKRFRIKADIATLYDTGNLAIPNGGSFVARARITRVAAGSVACSVTYQGRDATTGAAFGPPVLVSTQTLTLSSANNITIVANGALLNDVLVQSMVADWKSSST